jgi:hypothetical protein
MAATALTTRSITSAGLTPVPAEVAADSVNGNSYVNGPTTWLEATNTTGSSATVTITTPGTVDGNAIADKVITLAAAAKTRIGPLSTVVYGPTVTVTGSVVGVTLAVYQLA